MGWEGRGSERKGSSRRGEDEGEQHPFAEVAIAAAAAVRAAAGIQRRYSSTVVEEEMARKRLRELVLSRATVSPGNLDPLFFRT